MFSQTNDSRTSVEGKIICGYQGWFNCNDDGAGLGWKHYGKAGKFAPGYCTIDLWPDMSEFDADEKYYSSFVFSDSTKAPVFSSRNAKTVDRHFSWMRTYGIDGVFIQRFVSEIKRPKSYPNLNLVYDLCNKASLKNDRLIGVMYDLSGSGPECIDIIRKDWMMLCDKYGINKKGNRNYLTHRGKPLVAVWGVGFNDGRKYSLDDIKKLIDFFRNDPVYGNCSVLLGVPTYWRTLGTDCIKDSAMFSVLKMADIIHPWTVGRYKDTATANRYKTTLVADKQWCDRNKVDYMPVVFPGFSWGNLRDGKTPTNQIPRQKGLFFWQQMYNAVSAGAGMIYVAMFDEMDEGTAIFKCTSHPPAGESHFVDIDGMPSDYYLWLTGQAASMLKKQMPLTSAIPSCKPQTKQKIK